MAFSVNQATENVHVSCFGGELAASPPHSAFHPPILEGIHCDFEVICSRLQTDRPKGETLPEATWQLKLFLVDNATLERKLVLRVSE